MGARSWHRVDPVDVPAEGRVRSVTVDGHTVALARCGAGLGALENRCPHQGGPLGEGSIENGWLRCPWHGYDYNPLTGYDAVAGRVVGLHEHGVATACGMGPLQSRLRSSRYAARARTLKRLPAPVDEVLTSRIARTGRGA